jgi:tyrosyl-tRNA synthetase
MREWYELLTDRPTAEIDAIVNGHPADAKKKLAMEIVAAYHGTAEADRVLADWQKQFADRGDPEEIPVVALPADR